MMADISHLAILIAVNIATPLLMADRKMYIVSGGWWQREVQREYYYVRTANGRTLWMYYDRHRMGWYLHGEVE